MISKCQDCGSHQPLVGEVSGRGSYGPDLRLKGFFSGASLTLLFVQNVALSIGMLDHKIWKSEKVGEI